MKKCLYDNTQFILLLSKYCKINPENYFKEKLEQTIEFLKKILKNKDGLLGSAYDADSEGEEGNIMFINMMKSKNIENIKKYFEIKPVEIGKIK